MQVLGYSYPPAIAGLVGRYVRDRDAPILGARAGTGYVGEVLAVLGYTRLTGIDLPDGMLAVARAKIVYVELKNQTLGERLDFADDTFTAVVSAGVLTSGHAPPSCFDQLIRITRPGGHLIFTLSTSVYEAGGFRAKLEALSRQRVWRSLETTPTWRAPPRAAAETAAMARARVFQLPQGHRMAESIDFYFEFASPYGYLASTQIDEIGARHGREVAWRPIMLGAAFKETGARPLMHTPLKGPYLLHDVPRFARLLGVPFEKPPVMPANSLAASRACIWLRADDPALAKRLAKAVFRRTRPYTPKTNGKAERFIRPLLEDWAYAVPCRSSASRRRQLPVWLRHDNHEHPHGSLAGLPPASRLPARVNNLAGMQT